MTKISHSDYYTADGALLTESLLEQLSLLCETPTGSVALDRDLGINMDSLDMPGPAAQSLLAAELAVKIPKYIPRLKLAQVNLASADADGNYRMKVVVDFV